MSYWQVHHERLRHFRRCQRSGRPEVRLECMFEQLMNSLFGWKSGGSNFILNGDRG